MPNFKYDPSREQPKREAARVFVLESGKRIELHSGNNEIDQESLDLLLADTDFVYLKDSLQAIVPAVPAVPVVPVQVTPKEKEAAKKTLIQKESDVIT